MKQQIISMDKNEDDVMVSVKGASSKELIACIEGLSKALLNNADPKDIKGLAGTLMLRVMKIVDEEVPS